ncbi:MAG: hypothetical protein ACLUKN_03900 [Bacilli bacterium]
MGKSAKPFARQIRLSNLLHGGTFQVLQFSRPLIFALAMKLKEREQSIDTPGFQIPEAPEFVFAVRERNLCKAFF